MQPDSASARLPPLSPDAYDLGATVDSLERMVADRARFGDVFRVRSPTRQVETWLVNDPDDVKHVLLTQHRNYTKGVGLDRVKILLGNGIMVSEGEFWRRQRRMMQPMFHRRVIERFAAVIEAANEALCERWAVAAARGQPVDLTEDVSALILDIVLESIFGRDLATLADKMGGNPFTLVTQMPERDLKFAYRFRSLTRLVGEIVARRRDNAEEHFDFIAMLMAATDKDTGAGMSDRELIDEVMTLVVAGHETTAASLTMTWWLLAQHPEAQARLHAELDAVPDKPLPSYADTEALAWTQGVIKEALRLYPPGWLLSRRSIGPDRLGGYALPAGTDVFLSPYLVHRHPAHWDEPEAYRPERHTPAAEEARHKFAYIPFAVGPRHCIGENFAMYEMALHVARVARRFRLEWVPAGPVEFEAQINLRARHNLKFRLEPR